MDGEREMDREVRRNGAGRERGSRGKRRRRDRDKGYYTIYGPNTGLCMAVYVEISAEQSLRLSWYKLGYLYIGVFP